MESPGPSLLGNQVEGSAVSMTTSGLKKVDGNKMKWPPGTMGYHPIVLNGLQLSLRRQKQAFAAYNYASLDLPAKIDWKVLAGEELECQHIRYHQLQPNDNLTALTTTIKTSHAVGVVFANVEDSTELPSQYSLGTNESSNSKKINFPIILISSSDGAMLQESLNHHDVGEINAKIEIKNQSDVKLLRRTCMLPIQSECAASPGKSGSLIPGLRSSSRRGIEINLKELVKTLMLHVDGVQCVSDDLALFQHLITAFYQYEQMAEREVPQTDGGVFRKLSKHMEHMFEKDFPFYVTIAYRVHKKQQYYACDELSPFVQNCALKFERLPPKVIAETLKTFLTRDNFRVMVEPNSTPTVFEVLEESCIQMMVYSANLRSQESSSKAISHRQLYYSMIWISVACKCHVERGSRVIVNYWREHLTSKHKMIYLNSDSIHSIRRGMEFGYMLELPRSVAFAGECMAELLAAEGTVRSFRQIRECAVVLEQCFTEEEDFVMNLVRKPRLCYQAYFSQSGENKLRYLHPDGNLLVILQEGLLFLDSVLGIIRKRLWQSTQLEEEMKKWLSILLSLVDITSTHAESYLKDFLTTKSGGVTKLFREHIKRGVISKVQKNISKLNVEQFFELYQAFLIWPTWLVEQYLHQYHIPPDVKISSLGWRNLFSEFVDRFDSHHHKSLLEFLKCVGSSYQTQGRATDFVLDLLVLDVPSLFMADCDISTSTLQSDILAGSVSDNFYTFLSEFIQRNNLRTPILERVKVVWESLVEHSDFQQIILNVLQEELIPESSVLKDAVMTQPSIRLLIDHCVTMICQRIGSLREIKSRTHFCWGLLASCCRRIPISDTFEWVHLFTFIIDQLGRVYGMYCEFHGLSEEGISLVGGDLPSDVVESPCEEVPYVFQWVYRVQSLLAEWSQKFSSRKINYDAIQLYYNNFSNITRVSTLFYANAALIDMQSLVAIKADFNQNFELLNMFMIRYVPEKIDLGWCGLHHLLTTYGVGFPSHILTALSKHVIFPGESASDDKLSLSLSCALPAAVSKKFQPGVDVSLQITKELDLLSLKALVQALSSFLAPVEDNLMQMLVFFYLSESAVFEKYLHIKLAQVDSLRTWTCEVSSSRLPVMSISSGESLDTPTGITMEEFASALFLTNELLLNLIAGTATYTDVIANDSPGLLLLNTDCEFQILKEYAGLSNTEAQNFEGLIGFRAMLQLFQLTHHIEVIYSVCVQFHLNKCMEDPKLRNLQELVKTFDVEVNKRKLTTNDAVEQVGVVREALYLNEKNDIRFLNLFTAVADSSAFYQFVTEKHFIGQDGQALFNQQYQLVTTQLQHEEYNELVLNHLFAAFRLITPFVDSEQSFSSLMSQVATLGVYDASKQLETVNRNINLIRLWFSKAEGDTVEGVSNELNNVIEMGYYQFSLLLMSDGVKGNVELLYRRSVYPSGETEDKGAVMMSRSSCMVEQRWKTEQINDFVLKLGFLDVEDEMGAKIDHFLYLNHTARKLNDVYVKLRELGHPDYLKEMLSHSHDLPCALGKSEADRKVQQVRTLLASWEQQVAKLRLEYEQLLFFSIPKLLRLYGLIMSQDDHSDAVSKEVGFLFKNKPEVQYCLKKAVKELLEEKNFRKRHNRMEMIPIHIVGTFLAQLFRNSKLSCHFLNKRRLANTRSISTQPTQILHSCPGYSQSQIIQLIIHIYGGVPEPFEVLRCRSNATMEEIQLFLNPRRAMKRPFQFLILEVNKLPYQLQEALLELLNTLRQNESEGVDTHCIHFIETGISKLHEYPYIMIRDYRGQKPGLDFTQTTMTCQRSVLNADDFSCIKLVYGEAGDGKTHYIESQLSQAPHHLKIAVNECFVPLSAIQKLSSLPFDVPNCAVFFNITLIPPGESVDKANVQTYQHLLKTVNWFFFDLFLLGYVEDPATGQSFIFTGGMAWAVYIEVPSRNGMNAEGSLHMFLEDLPALGVLGTPHVIHGEVPYVVDEEVQLVCKYLKGYRIGGGKGIDRLYKEGTGFLFGKKKQGIPVKLSQDPNLTDDECRCLLQYYIPENMNKCKITQRLFIKYMKRRCEFLDNCPAFIYNPGSSEYIDTPQGPRRNDTKQLGSTLMRAMLNEVSDFCDPIIRENWALKPHHQLIYDFKDGGGTFALMSLHPDEISSEDVENFEKIGVEIPSMMELHSRKRLDTYLSRALSIPLDDGCLKIVDDSNYVLTLDFAIKMLNINERAECRVPVIIEGETGVGKTALVEMLSKLWNYSLLRVWMVQRSRMVDVIIKKINDLPKEQLQLCPGCVEAVSSLSAGGCPKEDELILVGELSDSTSKSRQFYTVLREELLKFVSDPLLSLIQPRQEDRDAGVKFSRLFAAAEYKNNSKDTGRLLYSFLNAEVKKTFYKLNIHSALTPEDVVQFLKPAFDQARELSATFEKPENTRIPFVTVFLDELNTSSCLGLFKELIVDRTLNGEPVPDNLFVIAACNPHRSSSAVFYETWMQGSYNVRLLHPSMHCLVWDYGALGEAQEREYVQAKFRLTKQDSADVDIATLTDLIVTSQTQIRTYALDHMKRLGMTESEASACSRSCVSQRDIQRVFTFSKWLCSMYARLSRYSNGGFSLRATLVSLGLVYYLRLDSECRKDYQQMIDHQSALLGLSFSTAFDEEINWFLNHIDLPQGIARTTALKENIFATIVCTMTHTPLIMVGAPGSSKTLSFNLTVSNMKGLESKINAFRNTDIFKSLDPQIYQCSRRTTSNEIQTVFSRAINRQRSHLKVPLPVYCVVFMDEAGLPEERHESLKALHFFLDSQEVSFVGVSNHVLDAAKSNRAVCLFRPEASSNDLVSLAKGCFAADPENISPASQRDIEMVQRFCKPFEELMTSKTFQQFFGLRDFIHFLSYLRRKKREALSPQLVMEAIERNFNGLNELYFQRICQSFLHAINSSIVDVRRRDIFDVLRSSLTDHPTCGSGENQMRYKLVIDDIGDGFVMHLLVSFGVLQRKNTRMYILSDFPEDAHLQEINTIAAIRHSATEGHTIIMYQTDSIHECFYDLFNHRFHRLDASDGPRFYSNIAIGAHIKPCRIHPDFQCLVVVKKTDLKHVPPPFLNRFEKYFLSSKALFNTAVNQLPPFVARIIYAAEKAATEFVERLGGHRSVYGYHSDTLKSLLISILPPVGYKIDDNFKTDGKCSQSTEVYFLESLLNGLRDNAGFRIPMCYSEESKFDSEEICKLVCKNSEFAGYMSELSQEAISKAVNEGLHALFYLKPPSQSEESKVFSVGTRVAVQLLCQWFTRFLCKSVLQLTKSEAVCLYQKRFPSSYILSYLNHQHHFSLKSLIESKFSLLNHCRSGACATKLVCFTRSSQVLHQVPAIFPCCGPSCEEEEQKATKCVEHLFFYDTRSLKVYKLASFLSYANMKNVIDSFSKSDTHSVLVLIVDMQETSRDVVNQIRLVVENVENAMGDVRKLFALVLHFPAHMAAVSCYNAFFLQGWDFHYLDDVGCMQKEEMLDISLWFRLCYMNKYTSTTDPITPLLENLMSEAATIVASRVFLRSEVSTSFNRPMTVFERSAMLNEFLNEKGGGVVLIERFNSYWQQSVMLEYLERAAKIAEKHEDSTSITNALQSIFKHLFFNFLVYMINKINDGMNIDVIFDPGCPQEVIELFVNILKVHPIPKLSELNISHVAGSTMCCNEEEYCICSPTFPFFRIINNALGNLVVQAQLEISHNVSKLPEQTEADFPFHLSDKMYPRHETKNMIVHIHSMLMELAKSDETTCLTVALQAILNSEELWERYLQDFAHQKLHLDLRIPGISCKIMQAAFGKTDDQDLLSCLSIFHAYVHVHKLNLARVMAILHPLDKIEVTASNMIPMPNTGTLQMQRFLHDVEDSGEFLGRPETLSTFVIETLFSVISSVALNIEDERREMMEKIPDLKVLQVEQWYKVYNDMISTPTLKDHIYRSRHFLSVQAQGQHNLMHALFVMLQVSHERTEEMIVKGLLLFVTIFKEFFSPTSKTEHGVRAPKLKDVFSGVLKILTDSCVLTSQTKGSSIFRGVLEGLFAHFFSEQQLVCDEDDVHWFLEIANEQHQWQISSLLKEGIGTDLDNLPLNKGSSMNPQHHSQCSLHKCVLMSTFKFYLVRILRKAALVDDETRSSVMSYFNGNKVHELLKDVLLHKHIMDCPYPYIPTFYQHHAQDVDITTAESKLMQQPLVHLYFLTIMEDLLDSDYNLSTLLKYSQSITKQCKRGGVELDDMLLLYIENQAVIQVMIMELAQHLNTLDDSKVTTACSLLNDINEVLDDVSMGGGDLGGHSLVLIMHMLKELRSFDLFMAMLTDQFPLLCEGIHSLSSYHLKLTASKRSVTPAGTTGSIFLNFGNEFEEFYTRVCNSMHAVHTSNGNPARVNEFVCVVQESSQTHLQFSGLLGEKFVVTGIAGMKIAMWLCIYNEYFKKQVTSEILLRVIKKCLGGVVEEPITSLFEFFLCPELVVTDMKEKEQLYSLFFNISTKDHNAIHLRAALTKMIAVVVGLPPKKSHLWFHLFMPEELDQSYVSGFMYEAPVGSNTYFLDTGLEVTKDGFVKHQDHILSSFHGGLTIHSHHLLLLLNLGALCVHMIFKMKADRKLTGLLISEKETVCNDCVVQLRRLWDCFGNSLSLSLEESNMLVEHTLIQHYKIMSAAENSMIGKFHSMADLKMYQALWQANTFEPAWKSLREHFLNRVPFIQNEVFSLIRSMDQQYPWFANESSLAQALLRDDSFITSTSSHLEPLRIFMVDFDRLQLGCDLLPKLLSLYQWIHKELSHSISYKEATQFTYNQLGKVLLKRISAKEDNCTYFENLQDMLNKYNACSRCTSERRLVITDQTALIHFLSNSVNGENGSDILFSSIVEIITFYNTFLSSLLYNSDKKTSGLLESVPCIHAIEFCQQSHLLWTRVRHGSFVQFIRRCNELPTSSEAAIWSDKMGDIPGLSRRFIDLHRLQRDVMSTYIAGKPRVLTSSIDSIRIPFKFKERAFPLTFQISSYPSIELQHLSQSLPAEYQTTLDESEKRIMKYEFHSASYHIIMEIITGLRTIIGHLQHDISLKTNHLQPTSVTLDGFVASMYEYESHEYSDNLFSVIGIYSISTSQFMWLKKVHITKIFDLWRKFIQLAEDGWYDFCTLPYGAKQPMNLPDEDAVLQIAGHYSENLHELIQDMKCLSISFSHLEENIKKTSFQSFQVSIVKYMEDLHHCSKCRTLLLLIPDTIRIEHYVCLRLLLRKIMIGIECSLEEKEPCFEHNFGWNEFVCDIWHTAISTPLQINQVPDGGAHGSSTILNDLKVYCDDDDSRTSVMPYGLLCTPNKEINEEDMDTSVQRVVKFLQQHNLEEYISVIEDNELDCDMLMQSSDRDLEEIGINNPIHRLKITVGVKNITLGKQSECAKVYPAHVLAEMFHKTDDLKVFCDNVVANNLDTDTLLHASDAVFKQLGVTKEIQLQTIRSTLNALLF